VLLAHSNTLSISLSLTHVYPQQQVARTTPPSQM
jgi:hypothetical protein